MPSLKSLDHLVLTVASLSATVQFYTSVLGMTAQSFDAADGTTRTALTFGNQKINLHIAGSEFEPKAKLATPGSAELCFLSDTDIADWITQVSENGVRVEDGPVARTGATGPILSIYIRDPDGNLIEISNAA